MSDDGSPAPPSDAALQQALRRLLQPLARLALAQGLHYQAIDRLLRQMMVEEARRMFTASRRHGLVSHVSTATGLTRREAGRLLRQGVAHEPAPRSLASEVFTRWLSDPAWRHEGSPRVLPRNGGAPSFDALARSVTQDVHPRSLLDELQRLDLVRVDTDRDTVALKKKAFVPHADAAHLFSLLADNVSDHMNAAVVNVLGRGDEHFEQALYADELSAESVRALRPAIAAAWSCLCERLAPLLEQHIADDEAQGRRQDQRVRIGFYSFADPVSAPDHDQTGRGAMTPARADEAPPAAGKSNSSAPAPGPSNSGSSPRSPGVQK